jgi:hypothetical protein
MDIIQVVTSLFVVSVPALLLADALDTKTDTQQ